MVRTNVDIATPQLSTAMSNASLASAIPITIAIGPVIDAGSTRSSRSLPAARITKPTIMLRTPVATTPT
jgi:hypothetical protein